MIRGVRREACVLVLTLAVLALASACGGGGGPTGTTTPPAAVAITLGTAPTALNVSQTYQFSATVTNTTNTGVTWAVGGVTGGNVTLGTISAAGLYTAPTIVPTPQNVSVTATSLADTTKTASASVAINITLALNLTTPTVQVSGTQQFSATIVGAANTAVTWSVNGVVGGNATFGTITAGGLYTAPAIPPTAGSVTITAASVAFPSITSTATVTLPTPQVSVSVNPTALDLQVNGTVQLTALVTTSSGLPISTAVTWGIDSPGNLQSSIYGSITTTGLYTAPATVPPGALAVVPIYVQSQENPHVFTVCNITITAAPVPLTISTTSLANGVQNTAYNATISAFGGAQPYSLTVTTGILPAGLALNGATGAITGTPLTPGTSNFTITATDATSPTHNTTTANLSIIVIPQLSISTAAFSNGAVGSAYSSALIAGGGVTPYTWSITSGTLPSGVTLNASTGVISGTPAAGSNGTYPLSVKVVDSGTPQQTQTFSGSFTIYTGLAITTTSLPNVVTGAGYSQSVVAVGGNTPYTFGPAPGSGPLPTGLSLNTSSGLISGTPTVAGTYNFTVQVSDSSSPVQSKTQAFTIIAYAPLTFAAVTLPNGVVGTAYTTTTLSAGGGATPYAWSETGALPAGLTLNASTGVISGTPAVGSAGAYPISVKVTDASVPAQSQSQNLTINIYTGLTITTTTLPSDVIGTTYNSAVVATGGTTPFTYSLAAGSGPLPGGVVLNPSTGALTGPPAVGSQGTYPITVQVSDSSNPIQTKTQALSITIYSALVFPVTTLNNGVVGTVYSGTTPSASGGTTAYTWTETGALPSGLTLSPTTGVISGTPAAASAGTYPITLKVTDSSSPTQSQSQSLSLTISNALSITTTALPNSLVSGTYSQSVVASGGTPSYTFALATGSGPLPTGVTLNTSSGLISGTTTTAGTYNFTVQVSDASSPVQTKTQALTVIVYTALTFPAPTLPSGVVGSAYTTTNLAASGGTTPYTWTETGALPSGLTLTTGGVLSGTPAAGTAGTYPITVKVTDSSVPQQTQSKSLSIVVYNGLTITTAAPLPYGVTSQAYNAGAGVQLAAQGGSTNYSWTLATGSGSIPTSLTLSATGLISGTPTATGTFNFTVMVTDTTTTSTQTKALSIVVTTAPSLNNIGMQGAMNQVYSGGSPTATGGTAPLAYYITTGSLPPGIAFSPTTGALTGTPTAGGSFSFTMKVLDSSTPGTPQSVTQSYTFGVLGFTPNTLPNNTVNVAYPSQTFTAANGPGPYNWSQTGTLPTGLTFTPSASTATLTGTPTSAGTHNFSIAVTGALPGLTATQSFSVTINAPTLTITTASLNRGAVGTVYSQPLAATGGTGALTWSIVPSAAALPPGLTVSGSTISGTPTTYGNYGFQIKVVDSGSPQQTQTSTSLNLAILGVTTTSLSAGVVGTSYSQGLAASGGTGAFSWALAAGSGPLPPGLTLAAAGGITGTPTAQGTYNFVAQVTDTNTSLTAPQSLSISITTNSGSLGISTSSLPAGQQGSAYSTQIIASGGVTPYTWSVVSGPLPTCTVGGVTFTLNSSTGVLSGTPDNSCIGTYSVTIQVTDSTAGTHLIAQKTFSLVLNSAPLGVCETGHESILQGQYAFELRGFNTSNSFLTYVGSMTLDGAGNIISGEADANAPGATSQNYNVVGTYTMGADNRGCATIRLNGGAVTLNTRIVVGAISGSTATSGQMIEFDTPTTSSNYIATGPFVQQTTATTTSTSNFTAPSGAYTYRNIGIDSSTGARMACLGVQTFSGGNISSTQGDCNDGGTITSAPLVAGNVGTYTSIDQYGRLTFLTGSGPTLNRYAAYGVANGSQALVMTTTVNNANSIVLAGQATQQANGPYSNSSVSGNLVFEDSGVSGNTGGVAEFGILNVPTSGTITGTSYENAAGTAAGPFTFTCSYSVASNGRLTLTASAPCGSNNPILYFFNNNTAYILSEDSVVAAGAVKAQTVPGGGFTASNVAGTFYGGTIEVMNQAAGPENNLLTVSGTGSNLTGTDVSDMTSTTYQQAGQSFPVSGTTIATSGLISIPNGGVPTVSGVAIDATHFVFADKNGSYPNMVTYGPTAADTVAISITSPSGAQTIPINGTLSVTAAVTGSTNTGVIWTVNGFTNGNSTFGTITGAGSTVTYTAPTTVPAPTTFTITATSTADSSKSASVNVTISGGVVISITSPTSPQTVNVSTPITVTASLTGASNTAITWTVNGVTNGNATYGTITGSGLSVTYNPPASVPSPSTFNITATSVEEPSQSAALSVTIVTSTVVGISFTSPANPASVTVGGTLALTATVTGTANTAVTWSIAGAQAGTVANGNSVLGTIVGTSPSANYNAPAAIPEGNNPVTITVTSQADNTKTATLTVTINTGATPNAINVPGNDTVTGINFNISTLTPTLGLADVGACTGPVGASPFPCSASVASVSISKSSTVSLWLLGQGLTNGAGTAVASGLTVSVSHGTTADVTISNVTAQTLVSGFTNITFAVTVSSSATSGPRDIVVTNAAGETQVFVGAITIP